MWIDGRERHAACIGGMLSVHDGEVRLVASTFEWQEDIDRERAKRAEADARNILGDGANRSARGAGHGRGEAEARVDSAGRGGTVKGRRPLDARTANCIKRDP